MPGLFVAALLAAFAPGIGAAHAEDAVLTLSIGPETRRFTAAQLLARPDAIQLTIPADVSYGRPMAYRAVPLLPLLKAGAAFDTSEARTADGFVSQIPLALVEKGAQGGAKAWIAIEEPMAPWPALPGKTASAGPFYIVWANPERSDVGSEQWPYQLASLTAVESPAHRWPQIVVDAKLPEDAPARRGQAVFTTQCLPCHRMKGAGAADVGPDLGQPMRPTQYLSPQGLRGIIRNPKAVRAWPQMTMPGFDETMLREADLEALIAYLAHMATR
ncbi:MAG TPA: cytochrome c [Xanthobacteraceae bacterium]|nr:cytochrome c [Xanthobacteraceae bacterium]